jgi:hypothetical protein
MEPIGKGGMMLLRGVEPDTADGQINNILVSVRTYKKHLAAFDAPHATAPKDSGWPADVSFARYSENGCIRCQFFVSVKEK